MQNSYKRIKVLLNETEEENIENGEYIENLIGDIEFQNVSMKYDKEEIKGLAFSELYTNCQSMIQSLGSCSINAKILNSRELAELLYIAYNRDEAEVFGLDRALAAGYDELYSTAPEVIEKNIRLKLNDTEKESSKLRRIFLVLCDEKNYSFLHCCLSDNAYSVSDGLP